jgi:hypothetical protein
LQKVATISSIHNEAVVWKDRIVYLAACTKRLFSLLLRGDRRGRHEQGKG